MARRCGCPTPAVPLRPRRATGPHTERRAGGVPRHSARRHRARRARPAAGPRRQDARLIDWPEIVPSARPRSAPGESARLAGRSLGRRRPTLRRFRRPRGRRVLVIRRPLHLQLQLDLVAVDLQLDLTPDMLRHMQLEDAVAQRHLHPTTLRQRRRERRQSTSRLVPGQCFRALDLNIRHRTLRSSQGRSSLTGRPAQLPLRSLLEPAYPGAIRCG